MQIVFAVIDYLAAVLLGYFFGRDAAVMDFTLDTSIPHAVVGDDFEEGAATAAWATKNKHNLSMADNTGEVVEQCPQLGFATEPQGGDVVAQNPVQIRTKGTQDGFGERSNKGGAGADALDSEVLEDNPNFLGGLAGFVALLEMAITHELFELEVLVAIPVARRDLAVFLVL